jgi:hypothetical protein
MALFPSTNQIVQGGYPIYEDMIANSGNIQPGLVLVQATDDQHCDVAGAGAQLPIGVADIIISRGQQVGVALNTGDPVKVAKGNFYFLGTIAANNAITKGQALICAASGQLQPAANIAIPSGATAVTSSSANPALTGSNPPGGTVVAIAEQSLASTGTATQILCRWVL